MGPGLGWAGARVYVCVFVFLEKGSPRPPLPQWGRPQTQTADSCLCVRVCIHRHACLCVVVCFCTRGRLVIRCRHGGRPQKQVADLCLGACVCTISRAGGPHRDFVSLLRLLLAHCSDCCTFASFTSNCGRDACPLSACSCDQISRPSSMASVEFI